MKAIKINTKLSTRSGIELAEGVVAVISEAYADVKSIRNVTIEEETKQVIPASVAIRVYLNSQAIQDNKEPLMDIEGIETTFNGLDLDFAVWQKAPAETLIVAAAQKALEATFPNKTEIIEI